VSTPEIVVIGSLNHDLSLLAPRLPGPGETIIADGHFSGSGGKGANQAVAAARLGGKVAMIGMVGDDDHGRALLAGLEAAGVEASAVGIHPRSPTGLAVITIAPDGENTIVGSSGANMELTPADIARRRHLIEGASLVIAQLEVPTETVAAAAELTRGTFVLNPAPARALPTDLLGRVDVLIPNRSELSVLADRAEPVEVEETLAAVGALSLDGDVVVTLGRDGALLVTAEGHRHHAAPRVDAVDATGAGDAFCGALAVRLSRGEALDRAIPFAVAAGAVAVTRLGAQDAMPTQREVEALLGQ
jgi:ribokinase